MKDKNTKIKIVFEDERHIQTWESIHFDEPIDELIRAFSGFLYNLGYAPDIIGEKLIEVGKEKLEDCKPLEEEKC